MYLYISLVGGGGGPLLEGGVGHATKRCPTRDFAIEQNI